MSTRSCSVCGCTDDGGCPPMPGESERCRWVAPNLCDRCIEEAGGVDIEPMVRELDELVRRQLGQGWDPSFVRIAMMQVVLEIAATQSGDLEAGVRFIADELTQAISAAHLEPLIVKPDSPLVVVPR